MYISNRGERLVMAIKGLPKELARFRRLTISVKEENTPVFAKLIEVAKAEGRSRSELIAEALREYLSIDSGKGSRLEQLEQRVKELEKEIERLRKQIG